MKKLSTILCTLALLFGALGGVSSVKAEKVYASPSSWCATWNAPSTFSWSSSDINGFHMVYTGFPTNNADWTQYVLMHVNVASLTGAKSDEKGAYLYVKLVDGNNADQIIKFYNGENTIYLSDYANSIDLANIKECLLWADMAVGANAGSATVTDFYLQTSGADPVDQNVQISVGSDTRNYQLYVPGTVQTNCPLVISLHGASGHSTDYSPFSKGVAAEAGCIVAYPQGKDIYFPVFGGTVAGWDASGEENVDVTFLKAVIEDVASKYQIDRKRIYCCGFSNGGMMTYAMSNVCSDEIAAFASISGYPINEFHLRHTGARPVPFLHIHGKADDFVKYSLVPTIVDEMVARLGANPVPTTTTGNKYTKSVYAAGDGSFPYVYYEIDEMGHNDYTANTEDGSSAKTMWNFFKQYTLDSPCDETLKWAPRIDENGYNPAEHGWTVNSGTTLLQFGGDQYTSSNQNVYHSLQFNSGSYKLSFKSTGAEGKTVVVKIEKLTSPNTTVLNTTISVGGDAELLFSVTDGWGEYKLTMTRPSASDAITITDLVITQTGDATVDYLPIANTADWENFSTMVKNGVSPLNARLTADVDAGSTMVGTSANPYQGIFDGAGHTLTFTYDGTEQFAAPFQYVNAATISDLKTTGSITTTNNQCGGIIGKNTGGNTTLNRCMSSATIESKTSGNGRAGGLAGRCTDGTLTFNYCMYDGKIICEGVQGASGFVGYHAGDNASVTINHCLVASTDMEGDDANFVGGWKAPTINSSYYLTKFGSSNQGTQLTDQQRYSGQAAYTLNQGIGAGALFFGQGKLNSSIVEATPILTSDASKKVLRTYKGETNFYSNPGGLLPDPALSSMLGWKFEMSAEAAYQTHLPAAQTTDRELYGTPDAYNLVIGSAGASTFVFPFTTDGLPSGVKAYDLTFDGSVIKATKVDKITADKPVLINAEAGTYKFESKLNWWESVDFSAHTETTNGALTGVYNTALPFSYVPADAYVLQNGADGLGFYQVEKDSTIKITSFRAYLTAPGASARSLRIVYADNETTSISEVSNKYNDETTFNLNGQRVVKAAKGLYIKNGNKVVIK